MSDFITNGPLPLAIVCLIIGFVFLVKGADLFVEGSSSIAKKLKVPSIVIGLTIVAIGTSLPEAAVSITASVTNNNALAISNVLGSNIFNLMVVIGVCAILTPVAVQKDVVRRDLPFSVICALLLLVLGYMGSMSLGRVDGIILLLLYIAFLGFMIYTAMKARKAGNENSSEVVAEAEEIKIMSVPKSILFIVIGAVGIMIGGDVVVDSAVNIATSFGMSQTLVGLTIVALGTSLPELVTSVVAAKKKEVDMALGNAIGSNVANILMILGIASSISPIPFHMEDLIDICVLVVFSLLIWLFAWTKKRIDKGEGLVMVVLYVIYVVYAAMR
ncbi:MAG: calcium/sodium antiporter [Lachnospiraceae bacterium]|nr:calcium/sodium antiporter [Lachnospiraceae bacterium]MDY3276184.1 calcium/sodium antiporter [Agathobacter sp.]